MNEIRSICTSVLSGIKPTEDEKKKVMSMADSIIADIDSLGDNEGLDIKAILVGSTARETWLSGVHDLDVFIMFPPDAEREELEEKGLYIARRVAEKSDGFEERYAEHPYIHAVFNGYEVDLVPAFSVESATHIKSAVDRTPFHNSYILFRIRGLEDDVLLLKQFMKGSGVYGSELKTHGFSGYLVELLIINYGSFIKTLEAACTWKNGLNIDIENHGTVEHDDPVVMVDPTDPARNVAAALSLDNLCVFIDKACEFLETPSESYFKTDIPAVLEDESFFSILKKRGTSVIGIEFEAPDVVEDVLFPQLHKLEESAWSMLERNDFRVYNSGVWAGESAVILFELESSILPALKKHSGPAVWSGKHAEAFKLKYKVTDSFSNVYIRNGKYMVEIPRKYPDAGELIRSELVNCGLGKHVSLSIKKEYHVLKDNEIIKINDHEFRRFLRKFFEK